MSNARIVPYRAQLCVCLLAFLATLTLNGQTPAPGSSVSVPQFGTYEGTIDTINVGALNALSLRIPIYHEHQRGQHLDQDIALAYNDFLPTYLSQGLEYRVHGGWNISIGEDYSNGALIYETQFKCEQIVNPSGPSGYATSASYFYTDDRGAESYFGQLVSDCMPYPNSYPTFTNTMSNVPDIYGKGNLLVSATGNNAVVEDTHGIKHSVTYSIGSTNNELITDTNGNTAIGFMPPISDDGSCINGNAPSPVQASPNNTPVITYGCEFNDSTGNLTGRSPTVVSYLDSSGNSQSVIINYKLYILSYNYDTPGSTCTVVVTNECPYMMQTTLLDTITFPDGTGYAFSYEKNSYGAYSGRLKTVTLPSGGTITYQRSGGQNNVGFNLTQQDYPYAISAGVHNVLQRTTADGTTTYDGELVSVGSQDHSTLPITQSSVTYPDNHQEVISFIASDLIGGIYGFGGGPAVQPVSYYETSRSVYNGAVGSQIIQSSTKLYNGAASQYPLIPILKIQTQTTENGVSKTSVQNYTNSGQMLENDDYDYGATSPTRKTITAYASFPGTNILDRPSSKKVINASGATVAETDYSYDEYSVSASGAPNLIAVSGSRGNVTTTKKWLSSSASIPTYMRYDDAGQVVNSTDGMGNLTNYTYDSSDTYLSKITYPPVAAGTFWIGYTVNPYNGLLIQSTDMNGKIKGYTYDAMLRPIGVCYPDGGFSKITYYPPNRQDTSTLYDSGPGCVAGGGVPTGLYLTTTKIFDGYGRIEHNIDATGYTVNTQYDSMGRVASVTNPFLSTPETNVQTYYDVLSRKVRQINQDQTTKYWCYNGLLSAGQPNCHTHLGTLSGSWIDTQDENASQWQHTSDGLGRLIEIMEPSSSSPSPSLETDYQYDLLDNLKNVSQNGANGETPRVRSFTYNWLSQLITSSNPETGAICYGQGNGTQAGCQSNGYDPNGNLIYKTDARGVTTNYTYDVLNRLQYKSYTIPPNVMPAVAATDPVTYQYDSLSNTVMPNAIGRLVTEFTGPANAPTTQRSITSYDAMGRVLGEQQCATASGCAATPYVFQYMYDLMGNPTYANNGDSSTGIGWTYAHDGSGRLQSVTSTWEDSTHPGMLFGPPSTGSIQYGPVGLLAASLGIASTNPQPTYNQAWTYDNRMRITGETDSGTVSAAQAGTGSIIFDGPDGTSGGSVHVCHVGPNCGAGFPDAGTSSVTLTSAIATFTASVDYDGEDDSTLATELQAAFSVPDANGNSPMVSAVVTPAAPVPTIGGGLFVGATLTLTSLTTGAASNYQMDVNVTDQSDYDYVASGTNLMGGQDASPGGTIYSYGLTYQPTSNVLTMSDSVNGNWGYTYDSLNRLQTAQAAPNTQTGYAPYGAALLSWGYDSFGNNQGATLSGATQFSMPQVTNSYTQPNNHIDGTSYDAAGNVTSDPLMGQNAYMYDAEGRIAVYGGTVQYLYDAEGRRVAKLAPQPNVVGAAGFMMTNQYLLGLGGEQVTELDGQGNWLHSNAYAGGKLLATYDNVGLHFHFNDWLGSRRVQASGTGSVEESCLSLPYGNMLNCSGTGVDATEQHFTGKERDTESGLDYFGARYYGSSMGRFMSPDPIKLTEDRLVNPANTLNLYSYAANNPLKYVDPDGEDVTYFYDQSGVAGHAVLFAYNQQTGDSATESFGPIVHSPIAAGESMFDLGPGTSLKDITSTYAALTIQTSPELAQQVIQYIRSNPDPANWMAFGPNCSTQCSKILQKFKLEMQHRFKNPGLRPKLLWNDLRQQYNPNAPAKPTPGQDYGQPRTNMFNALSLSLQPAPDNTSVTTSQHDNGPCGGQGQSKCQ